jgi:LmbE family N-acetylglucosaminyl deacetylase
MKMKLRIIVFVLFFGVTAGLLPETSAQVKPVYDRGAAGLEQAIKRLGTSASVMMIGAHPDDEDTALLAYLARGKNARTAYLSLTRGDGGQNIIGGELGESLGVIRTEELLQARRLDGAEQFFTRAYDYGFSKTLDEARSKWDEKIVLCDVVRGIRAFRPLVVVSQFSGTPADGHGQHQYAGYITPLAVKAAADPAQCSGTGDAWQVQRTYRRQGFRSTGEPDIRVNTGTFDTFLGRSYFEIAMEARSQHKSQGQGSPELRGDVFSGLLNEGKPLTDIFDGIDTSLSGNPSFGKDAAAAKAAAELASLLVRIDESYRPQRPFEIVKPLAEAHTKAAEAEAAAHSAQAKAEFRIKRELLSEAVALAAGIQIDALSTGETAAAGEKFDVTVSAFYPANSQIGVNAMSIEHPSGWTVSPVESLVAETGGFYGRGVPRYSRRFSVTAAANETPTQPYWLRSKRKGELFDWSFAGDAAGKPFAEDRVYAKIDINVAGTRVELRRPIEFRYVDDVRGEIRRSLNIVPPVTVSAGETLRIVKRSPNAQTVHIPVAVMNNSNAAATGSVLLRLPSGWTAKTQQVEYDIEKPGDTQNIEFEIGIPADAGDGNFSVEITKNGEVLPVVEKIEYPHIDTHRVYRPAEIAFVVLDVKTTARKIAYIPGSGDSLAEAAKSIGFDVDVLDQKAAESGDLSKYQTVVLGIRASEVVPNFPKVNKRLLEWVRAGGTLVVQYQRPSYAQNNFTPFPVSIGPRVTDEDAAIKILQSEHPLLNQPNKITDRDFADWVQERNLYNFAAAEGDYVGLLESHDAGEAENNGGLVTANVGKGKYVYCSYSLFRQLPAGVPGAYRLLANLLSY